MWDVKLIKINLSIWVSICFTLTMWDVKVNDTIQLHSMTDSFTLTMWDVKQKTPPNINN